jgi:hypothetical protein
MPQARHPLKDAAESTQKSLARVGHRADDNPVLVRGKALRADTLTWVVFGPAREQRDFDGFSRRKLPMASAKNECNGLSSLRSRRA